MYKYDIRDKMENASNLGNPCVSDAGHLKRELRAFSNSSPDSTADNQGEFLTVIDLGIGEC
jgi:hypothetical protein